jgi:hypothetical protein
VTNVSDRDGHTGNVFDRLALRIRQTVRDVHSNELSGVERFSISLVNPFTIAQLDGDLVLVDGDPDFTIGETLRARLTSGLVQVNDLVWCSRQDQEFHAFDVISR